MTEPKENSSLPLLLSMTGAILLVAVGGWFFLDQDAAPTGGGDRATTVTRSAGLVSVPDATAAADEDGEATDEVTDEGTPAPATEPPPVVAAELPPPVSGVETELRMARMAADADVLIFPEDQSALHYYGLVLDAEPTNAVAIAELDAILANVAQTVAEQLDAAEYEEAYKIAVLVARLRPEHTLVLETQTRLDDYTEQLVEQAVENARAGKDREADALVARAAALPGRNPEYIGAVRDSITEIRDVRVAAERDRARRAELAADEARSAWVSSVRSAIQAGNLVTPAGASARDLLAEDNPWNAERTQLAEELMKAVVETSQFYINDGRLTEAEVLVNAAAEMGVEPERHVELREALDAAFIEFESRRIAQMSELVQLKRVDPRYPKRAHQFNITGWVNVYFTVTPSGETADIEVVKSEPEKVFDRAAVSAVEKWEFQPVEYRGQIISRRAAARLVFNIQ